MIASLYADIGYDGGDEVVVTAMDAEGNVVASSRSIAEKEEHILSLELPASGEYTFRASLNREGEESLTADAKASFVLPLGVPAISSATSAGGGSVDLAWSAVREADGYNIYCDGVKVDTAADTKCTVTGLTVGKEYTFRLESPDGLYLVGADTAVPAELASMLYYVEGIS